MPDIRVEGIYTRYQNLQLHFIRLWRHLLAIYVATETSCHKIWKVWGTNACSYLRTDTKKGAKGGFRKIEELIKRQQLNIACNKVFKKFCPCYYTQYPWQPVRIHFISIKSNWFDLKLGELINCNILSLRYWIFWVCPDWSLPW